MRKKTTIAKAVFVVLSLENSNVAFASLDYLCLPEYSVGYKYNESEHRWYPTTFRTPEKYLLRQLDLDGKDKDLKSVIKPSNLDATMGFFEQGKTDELRAFCREVPTFYGDDSKHIVCKPYLFEVELNDNASKFIATFTGSYLQLPAHGQHADNPFIVVGHCEPYNE